MEQLPKRNKRGRAPWPPDRRRVGPAPMTSQVIGSAALPCNQRRSHAVNGGSVIERFARRLPFYYGWVVVAVVFSSMALGVNARTAFSLLFPPILDEFGWPRGVTAGAFSFGFLVAAPLTPLLGRLMDARGPRLVMELGVIVMAAGLLLVPLATAPWHIYATLGVLVGGGSVALGY